MVMEPLSSPKLVIGWWQNGSVDPSPAPAISDEALDRGDDRRIRHGATHNEDRCAAMLRK
jgi:hypothetical protein